MRKKEKRSIISASLNEEIDVKLAANKGAPVNSSIEGSTKPFMMRRRKSSLDEHTRQGSNEKYRLELLQQFAEDVRKSIQYENQILSKSFKVAAIN